MNARNRSDRSRRAPRSKPAGDVSKINADEDRSWFTLAVALVWVVGFFVFFYSFAFPNSSQGFHRTDIWQQLPILLIDLIAPVSVETGIPSGWRYLPQRFDLMLVAAIILAGAWGTGHLILRLVGSTLPNRCAERTVFAFGIGLSALSLVTLGFGLIGFLSRGALAGVIVLAVMGECVLRLRRTTPRGALKAETPPSDGERASVGRPFQIACIVVVVPFLVAMLLGAMLPPTDFDVKEYHLQGPKEFFQAGQITMLPHNVYTSFPFLTEMLSLLAMVLRDDWYRGALAGKAVLMCFAPLTALAVFAAGRRWFTPQAGWLAAVIYLTTPWVYRISIIAYTEGALSFYLAASLLAIILGVEGIRTGVTGLGPFLTAGLLAGSAMACKYPGALQVVIPLGAAGCVATWIVKPRNADRPAASASARVTRVAAGFALGVILTVGPWLAKNTVETGNPVYPLLYSVFGGADWDDDMNVKWRGGHRPDNHQLGDLSVKFIDVTAKSDWQSPLLFGLAPLCLLMGGPRRWPRLAGFLAAYGLLAVVALSASYWANSPRLTAMIVSFGLGSIVVYVADTRRSSAVLCLLWAYIGFLFLAWWILTHRVDRFWVPMIPVICLLAGIGATWSNDWRWKASGGILMSAAILFNLVFITTPLCGFNAYLSDLEIAGQQSRARSMQVLAGVGLPEDAKVLFVGEAQVFDARFEHVYNTVFDRSLFQEWVGQKSPGTAAGQLQNRSADDIRAELDARGITHIFVNWDEILRYRTSYGYTDFVAPKRFSDLERLGLLEAPTNFGQVSLADLSEERANAIRSQPPRRFTTSGGRTTLINSTFGGHDAESKRELNAWAPSLSFENAGQSIFIWGQLFRVSK